MKIELCSNSQQWDNFVLRRTSFNFLQSWQWGEFQQAMGWNVFRLAVKREDKIVAGAGLVKRPLALGWNYFYCPRGPLFSSAFGEVWPNLADEIKHLARKEKAIFLRFEPPKANWLPPSSREVKKSSDVQPRRTIILDLSVSEQELLRVMHPKTRYNIRLSQRKGVSVRQAKKTEAKQWLELLATTAKRDGFRPHSAQYYQQMLAIDWIKMFFAVWQGHILAAGIFSFWGNAVVYLHGASANVHRSVMAPYALHWHLIKLAKESGKRFYDFYGIDERKWPGVTRFKRGFGGQEVAYPGTFDWVFNPKVYYLYQVGKLLKYARITRSRNN